MLQRTWSVIQKEFIQNIRDRRTLVIMLMLPLLQLLLFGYAISMNVRHIPTVVSDMSLDAASRSYLDAMSSSGYFDIVAWENGQEGVMRVIGEERARAGIIIPPDFAAHTARGDASVMFLVDGSELFTSQSAFAAANVITQQYSASLLMKKVSRSGQTLNTSLLDTHIRILYNPDMKDLWFIIPGMIALILQTQTIVLTANAVVREREMGTIEQILVTPIRPIELMIGKMIPNAGIAMFNMLTVIVIGVFWFHVPFQGNFWFFLLLSLIYIAAGLGLGLLISTISENQRQTQQLTIMFTMVGQVLGGFIFPRYAMPAIIRLVGNIFPLTYFVPISRGIMTKGIGGEYLTGQIAALVIYILIIMFFAGRAFRQRLE
jgi:ABC-2 type transport system permease protein